MLTVIALGGNALLQRGEPLDAERLTQNSKRVAKLIAQIAKNNQIVIVHGNGPQVGLLALQADAYKKVHPYPFDILDAESQGMIGYILQQAINNHLPEQPVATLLTQVIVNKNDPAFTDPTKPIGPVYNTTEADNIRKEHPWILKVDGEYFRRVVPSPKPIAIHELSIIKTLLKQNVTVIAGGGGGIPCIQTKTGQLIGVEAVVDKDMTASLIARELKADRFIILTDVNAVYENWGKTHAKPILKTTPKALEKMSFSAGSMAPKIKAACQYVNETRQNAEIGHLNDLIEIVKNQAGTIINPNK